jgi:predicted MFS family arabinose efflux permease
VGSAVSGFTYDHGGWGRVCLLGGIIGVLAVATALRRPRAATPEAALPAAEAPIEAG